MGFLEDLASLLGPSEKAGIDISLPTILYLFLYRKKNLKRSDIDLRHRTKYYE
jgi:hypothetical protein